MRIWYAGRLSKEKESVTEKMEDTIIKENPKKESEFKM